MATPDTPQPAPQASREMATRPVPHPGSPQRGKQSGKKDLAWKGNPMWTNRARALTPNRRERRRRAPVSDPSSSSSSLSSSLPLFHRYSGAACGAQRRVQGGGVRGRVHTTKVLLYPGESGQVRQLQRAAVRRRGRCAGGLNFYTSTQTLPTRAPRHLLYIYSEPFAFQTRQKNGRTRHI